MSNSAKHIEALLFVFGTLTKKEIQETLGLNEAALSDALRELESRQGGIVLVDDGKELSLRAAPEASELIDKVRKDEYSRDVGRAGLEALAAVLYRGPLTRSEIDFIRGVNSSQTLRTLTMRGLLRKIQNPRDERSFLYEATTDLLSELGLRRTGELPKFEDVREKLKSLEAHYRDKESHA